MARSGSYYVLWGMTYDILCLKVNYKELMITDAKASWHDTGV
jgi:hypothetical protein